MAEYVENQMTVMNVTDRVAKVTFNATLRPGYTREMLHDTIESYCVFIVAIRENVRQLAPRWSIKHWPDSDTFLINLWDSSKGRHGMNFFTEHSTAQSALDFYWQCKDDLAAIDTARVLEVANEGEREATLQPDDKPYPVPTIIERTIARQRHDAFADSLPEGHDLVDTFGDR